MPPISRHRARSRGRSQGPEVSRALILTGAPGAGKSSVLDALSTLLGRAELLDTPRVAARFAARHPASAQYAGFADFHLYRVTIERGHLVAGFGRIAWVEAAELRLTADAGALVAAEAEIVAHMNRDHADAVELYAQRLLRRTGTGWRMTGIDPEGIDLRRPIEAGGEPARLNFAAPVLTPAMARHVLVELARTAREMPGD